MGSKPTTKLETTLVVPSAQQYQDYGKLSYLASFCKLHQRYSPALLRSLFLPAVTHNCVRFFTNDTGVTAAALIWARLSDDVARDMIFNSKPPNRDNWNSGGNLWFLDLIAPFGHGLQVARHLARNPPDGPFYFARLDSTGKIRKVTRGDASKGRRGQITTFQVSHSAA